MTRAQTLTLLFALALLAPAAIAQEARLHKDLEANRIAIAKAMAKHVVSVEIDYDREAARPARPALPFPGMGGEDPNDPFARYDVGPFSGLVVSEDTVLISDRCLGSYNNKGAGREVESINITMPCGMRFKARVHGRHQELDLALLKVTDGKLTDCPKAEVLKLPEGEIKLERGQQVFVVGRGPNPLRVLMNDGIVSAVERENRRAFQLDARVGNATLGAPVVNIKGELVGLVSLHRHAEFGQASGVSYAAYAHEVRRAHDLLKEGKFIERPKAPFMGVGANKKWPDKPGLEVGNVVPGSGADKAGLRVGDVILQVDDIDMNDIADLIAHIQGHKVGDTLKVKILRGEKESTVEVTLGARP